MQTRILLGPAAQLPAHKRRSDCNNRFGLSLGSQYAQYTCFLVCLRMKASSTTAGQSMNRFGTIA